MPNPIKICDPLYDYIYLEEGMAEIIYHPSFQRLRSIRQLGFADQAFPSGTHNRYTHSLGVCHLAGQAFDSIMSKNSKLCPSKKKLFRRSLCLAALLHDIGHGPLSHSSEGLMPDLKKLKLDKELNSKDRQAKHEDYSVKFILDKEALYHPLTKLVEPEAVAQILHPEFKGSEDFFTEGGLNFLPLLRQIISSAFDVDRMDYLYRDSLSCGVKYGLIDYAWLISHFDSHIQQGQVFLAIDSSAIYTLESLLLGRQHMGLVVYFHHKSSIYNHILRNYSKECSWELSSSIADYSQFTDIQLFEKLKSDSNPWAQRITQKKPYLRLYEAVFFEPLSSNEEFLSQLVERLKQEALNYILTDSKKHNIKPAKNPAPASPIFLKNQAIGKVELIKNHKGLLSLPSRFLQRVYVQPEHYTPAKKLLKSLI